MCYQTVDKLICHFGTLIIIVSEVVLHVITFISVLITEDCNVLGSIGLKVIMGMVVYVVKHGQVFGLEVDTTNEQLDNTPECFGYTA